MPYVRLWIHLIWSTKNREPSMQKDLRKIIFDHILQNAKEKDVHIDCIDGHPDHVHVFLSMKANQSVSKVAQLIKGESSHWINQSNLTPFNFEWQEEYIAISVSESIIPKVQEYIKNQEEHHRKKSFAEEYQEIFKKYKFVMEG